MNRTLMIGSLLGFLSVVFGAYAEHALKAKISVDQFNMITKALSYHQLYSVVIVVIALGLYLPLTDRIKKYLIFSAWSFISGVIFFSFSIYLAVFTGLNYFLQAAPIGGVMLMVAWLVLLCTGMLRYA